MELNEVAKKDLVHRYLNGQMTPAEQDEFELLFVDDPELIEELEATEAFGRGANEVWGADADVDSLDVSPGAMTAGSTRVRMYRSSAILVIGILVGVVGSTSLWREEAYDHFDVQDRVNIVRVENLRSSKGDAPVILDSKALNILHISVDRVNAGYDYSLYDGEFVFRSGRVVSDSYAEVSIGIAQPQIAEFRLRLVGATGEVRIVELSSLK